LVDEEIPETIASTSKDVAMANEDDIAAIFDSSTKPKGFRDQEFYMSHYQKDAVTEKGYSLTDGASFVEQARGATFDLAGDEGVADRKRRLLNWDKKKKKFVQGGGVGSDNVKLVKTESGTKLPATYRSGRFDEWKAKTHSSLPRVGEMEGEGAHSKHSSGPGGHRFKHHKITESKPLDKLNTDYERKTRQMKKRGEGGAGEADDNSSRTKGPKGLAKGAKAKAGSRYGGKSMGRVKSELKSANEIRKSRKMQEKRKAKNARPTRKARR